MIQRSSRHVGRLIVAFLLATSAFVLIDARQFRAPYDWDEVDYIQASRLGVAANLLERGSMTVQEFVAFALHKSRSDAVTLPADYDESSDPLVRRHYHPPGVVSLLAMIPIDRPEWVPRISSVVGGAILIATMLAAYANAAGTPTLTGVSVVAILAAWIATLGFGTLSFHGWQAVWSVALAIATAAWLRRPSRPTAVSIGVLLGLAALTLETAAILAFAVLILLVWPRALPAGRVRVDRVGTVAIVAVVATAVVVCCWPGAILKLSIVKIAALYAYRVHIGQEYADVPHRAAAVVGVLGPVVACAVISAEAAIRKRFQHQGDVTLGLFPFAVVGTIYIAALLPFALNPVYLLPGAAPLAVVAARAIDDYRLMSLRLLSTAVVVLSTVVSLDRLEPERAVRLQREDEYRLAALLEGRQAYVDGAHIYQFYLGPGLPMRPLTVSPDGLLTTREAGAYRTLGESDLRGSVVGLQKGRLSSLNIPSALKACTDRGETETLRVFDCAASEKTP